jgi:hypothetical protein
MVYNSVQKDPETGKPKTEKRGIFASPVKQSQLPSSYLDGSFLKSIPGKEANPFVDPTKLKMGLVNMSGVSLATTNKEAKDRKNFYPIVAKWNEYDGSDKDGTYHRLGAPYPYIDNKEEKVLKLPVENGMLILLLRSPGSPNTTS